MEIEAVERVHSIPKVQWVEKARLGEEQHGKVIIGVAMPDHEVAVMPPGTIADIYERRAEAREKVTSKVQAKLGETRVRPAEADSYLKAWTSFQAEASPRLIVPYIPVDQKHAHLLEADGMPLPSEYFIAKKLEAGWAAYEAFGIQLRRESQDLFGELFPDDLQLSRRFGHYAISEPEAWRQKTQAVQRDTMKGFVASDQTMRIVAGVAQASIDEASLYRAVSPFNIPDHEDVAKTGLVIAISPNQYTISRSVDELPKDPRIPQGDLVCAVAANEALRLAARTSFPEQCDSLAVDVVLPLHVNNPRTQRVLGVYGEHLSHLSSFTRKYGAALHGSSRRSFW